MLKSPPNSWDLCGPRAYTKTNIFLTLSAKQIGTTDISKVSRENSPAANKKINYFAAFVKTDTIDNTHDVLHRERFNNSVLGAQTSRSGLVK